MLRPRKAQLAPRTVLMHFHIFKNGGTSFDFALKREFGRRFAEFDGKRPMHAHCPEEVADYLQRHSQIRALSSHHFRFPLPQLGNAKILSALFLRHPLDRMHSIYRYERQQKSKSPGSLHAKKYDFPDYVRWRLGQGQANLLCNFHASILTCNPRQGRRIPDAELARKRLREVTILGTVERLEESLAMGELAVSPWFPGLNLATTPQNVTRGRKQSLQERIDAAERACGAELFAEVAARNVLDLELHALAEELLQQRISASAKTQAHLLDFRARCAQLSS